MKLLVNILSAALVVAGVSAMAQQNKPEIPKFDSRNEVRIRGEVLQVLDYKCPISGSLGSHLILKDGDQPIEIHVAPVRFLKEFGIEFKPGDVIVALGTRGTFDGKPAFLPRVIMIGNNSYSIRDPKGNPLW